MRLRHTASGSLVQACRAVWNNLQLAQDPSGNLVWRFYNLYYHCVPPLRQRRKLGLEQSSFHVMIFARLEASADQVEVAFQIDPVKIPATIGQAVAIFLFQR